jgi:hypothetical protein
MDSASLAQLRETLAPELATCPKFPEVRPLRQLARPSPPSSDCIRLTAQMVSDFALLRFLHSFNSDVEVRLLSYVRICDPAERRLAGSERRVPQDAASPRTARSE